MNDKIIEHKTCTQCNEGFSIYQEDIEFYEKISPIFGGNKYQIPSPTLCPDCRQQRRLAWRNERNLYKRKCDATGKDIVSMYSPDKELTVYSQEIWWGDSWDALDFGINYCEEKEIFTQINNLLLKVPQPSLINNFQSIENASYSSYSGNLKNCYLVHESASCENTFYSENSRHIHDSFDLTMATRCHKCYYSCNIFDCNKVFYSQNSTFCKNSYLLQNCDNCNFCFGCENLSQKSYCINNIQYSKEEYFDKLEVLLENTDFEEEYYKSKQDSVKYMFGYGNETVSGNYIFNSSNAVSCYHVKNLTDGKYCSYLSSSSKISQDCYDYDYFGGAQRVYESITTGGNSDSMLFCSNSWEGGVNNFYSIMCYNCKNVFGCIGLKRKEYCVFNKQYTKEEYEKIVPQIIEYMQQTGEWGEFFPIWMSPFGYNESIAQTYFPLNKRETRKLGAKYSSYTAEIPKVEKVIQSHRLPKQVNKIPNDILNWAIECEETGRNFRITPQELNFYRKHNIAVPTKHPDQRYFNRQSLLNPRVLFATQCSGCNVNIHTTYSPKEYKNILCETCYNKKIY